MVSTTRNASGIKTNLQVGAGLDQGLDGALHAMVGCIHDGRGTIRGNHVDIGAKEHKLADTSGAAKLLVSKVMREPQTIERGSMLLQTRAA